MINKDITIPDEELEMLLGAQNKSYYMLTFCKFKGQKKFLTLTFNLYAFILGPFWFAYRKMYILAIISAITNFIISSFIPVLEIRVCINFMISLLANRLYYESLKIKYCKIKNKFNEGQVIDQLKRQGVKSKLIIVIIILYILFVGYFFFYKPISKWNNIAKDAVPR